MQDREIDVDPTRRSRKRYEARITKCTGGLQVVAIGSGLLSITSASGHQQPFDSALRFGLAELAQRSNGGQAGIGLLAIAATLLISTALLVIAHFWDMKRTWAAGFAIVIIGLDAIPMLVFGNWWAMAFHGYIMLWLLWGFVAMRRLNEIDQDPSCQGGKGTA